MTRSLIVCWLAPRLSTNKRNSFIKIQLVHNFCSKEGEKTIMQPLCRRQKNDRANSVQNWLKNDYATFVHNRVRKGLQRKPLIQRAGLRIHTVAKTYCSSSATPRGCASYQLQCCLLALLPIFTAAFLHCCLLELLPICTATYLHCCLLAPPLKCITAGFHYCPIFQTAPSAKVLQSSQSKQSKQIFCKLQEIVLMISPIFNKNVHSCLCAQLVKGVSFPLWRETAPYLKKKILATLNRDLQNYS